MAIQMRRGLREDFDPYKMLPGEWAVSIDASTSNQIVWMCFSPGICKRMGTYEDFVEQVKEATADIKTEYVEEFDKILDEIKVLSSQVSDDKDAVVSIKTTIEDEYLPQIQEALLEIQEKVSEAKNSADAAAVSAENAKKSEVNAKNSETEAKTSETNAATSESNAKTSETNAATSATTATAKATDAANYASNAETSALTATNKAIEASQYAEEAAESAKQSQISADAAAVSEANAKTSEANAKTYAEQAKEVSAVEVMTEKNNGIGKPDGDTITVDENGTFKAIKAEQDGNGKVISDTYILRESILNSQEEIDANTSEANIAGALALKKSIVKSTCVYVSAIPNEELDSDNAIGKFRFVVPISVDYSGINGKILSTSLIHIGNDSTDANGELSKNLLLAGMGGDGNEKIIKNILVYSKDYQTVRAKILVEYVEN